MIRTRRSALLLVLAVAVLLGAALPAHARFSDTGAVTTAPMRTVDVLPPTNLSTAGTKCVPVHNSAGQQTGTRLEAKLSWTASPTPGVVRYVVSAHVNGTLYPYPVAVIDAPNTVARDDYDASVLANDVKVSITAVTGYGWTEQSVLSGSIRC
ncbi:hypothetical protein [Trujillonella endophytica]|uniref:Ig-like domain-containing protein n=1 Tax=Trujillonella endophytica TaxID=673521 RepID=A0A1H8UUG2_9ACTN|nr:hypothetical protein [Trujillella endophytica]SEP06819.1 hypothetical protein SAMN05660991_03107 [Trujillella endophytica]